MSAGHAVYTGPSVSGRLWQQFGLQARIPMLILAFVELRGTSCSRREGKRKRMEGREVVREWKRKGKGKDATVAVSHGGTNERQKLASR